MEHDADPRHLHVTTYLGNKSVQKTSSLSDRMTRLEGKSAIGLATVSPMNQVKMIDSKLAPDKSSFRLSIKMHNAFRMDIIKLYGLPRQEPTGLTVPNRIMANAMVMGSSGDERVVGWRWPVLAQRQKCVRSRTGTLDRRL